MKLNLVPTYVGKGRQLAVAIVFGAMLFAISIGITTVMISDANRQLAKVKEQAQQFDQPVQAAIDYSNQAQPILTNLHDVVRNINLAQAMQKHNSVYPDFYASIFPYIPDFFRVVNIQANPKDDHSVTLRITGELKGQEQYRDLMLAMLRIKGAQTVTRTPYAPDFSLLPGVTADNQNPVTPPLDSRALPTDPLDRLDFEIASGREVPFTPKGYGGEPGPRGPMPGYQEITVTIDLVDASYNLMTPNPSATLGTGGTTGRNGGGGGKGLKG